MFWRMVTMADDFGRFEAEPVLLLSLAFPGFGNRIKLDNVKAWLNELVACDHVRTYVCNCKHYGIFTNWERYQGKARAKESKYPDPPANICEQMQTKVLVSESESVSVSESESEIGIGAVSASASRCLPPPKGKRPWPPDFELSDDRKRKATEIGVRDPEREWQKFRARNQSLGTRYANWDRAWENWCLKAVEFAKPAAGIVGL